jgi:hypothetical protein
MIDVNVAARANKFEFGDNTREGFGETSITE